MPTYTQNQTVFALSAAANLASCFEGSASEIEAALGNELDSLLPRFQPQLGSWEVVWGPVVYVPPASDLSGNVMYVARGGRDTSPPGQLVVAIAGTNPYSAFDWIVEDAFVSTQVSWSTGNPPPGSAPKISLGTFLGLTILQAMVAGPAQPGVGSTLADFLTSQAGSCPLVTVTGHSLGGALAPAVALWLSDQGGVWNPRGAVGLSCLASADRPSATKTSPPITTRNFRRPRRATGTRSTSYPTPGTRPCSPRSPTCTSLRSPPGRPSTSSSMSPRRSRSWAATPRSAPPPPRSRGPSTPRSSAARTRHSRTSSFRCLTSTSTLTSRCWASRTRSRLGLCPGIGRARLPDRPGCGLPRPPGAKGGLVPTPGRPLMSRAQENNDLGWWDDLDFSSCRVCATHQVFCQREVWCVAHTRQEDRSLSPISFNGRSAI